MLVRRTEVLLLFGVLGLGMLGCIGTYGKMKQASAPPIKILAWDPCFSSLPLTVAHVESASLLSLFGAFGLRVQGLSIPMSFCYGCMFAQGSLRHPYVVTCGFAFADS